MPVFDRKPVESMPSSLSAFRFATLIPELTVNGAWPEATFKPSAVEAAFEVSLFVSCSALPPQRVRTATCSLLPCSTGRG